MAHQRIRVSFSIACSIVLIILPINVQTWDSKNCPSFCECFSLYGLRWAECVGRRLYSIHTRIDEAVQALDLSNNSIFSLGDHELRDAGLTNLKLLNLSQNAISEIGLIAFVGLPDLRVLDLSKNHLYYILPDTFVDNKKLEVLELGGNNLNQHVPRLRSSSLASLGLAGCRISHVPSDTFDQLPRLRALDLSNNMMIQLETDVLKGIPNLAILVLERNPWSCNSGMFELQDRLKELNVMYKQVCNRNGRVPQSKQPSKKFEKMIALEGDTTVSSDASGRLLAKIKNWRTSWKDETTSERCPPLVMSNAKSSDSFGVDLSTISPYWFLAIGFLLGAAFSTVVTYLWLTKTPSRPFAGLRRRRLIAEYSDIASQRTNLLQNLWQNNEDANRPTTECPGTPPPPYRDVILHSTHYPLPHIQALVFGNDDNRNEQRRVNS